MSSIESLKEQARRHEQKEEWQKALALYAEAIERLVKEEQPDIGLYNRVGDLQTRIGNFDRAAEAYEEAVDLYVEAELPNNAIAVCKKIIRNMPKRSRVYLKMGQVRAKQGFFVDARANFLTYAERMQAEGEIDEAFRALIEFADLAPEDLEIRLAVGGQLLQSERTDEAMEQLSTGYRQAASTGKDEMAGQFAAALQQIDPNIDLEAVATAVSPMGFETTAFGDDAIGADLDEIGLGAQEDEEEEAEVEGDFGFQIGSDVEAEEEEAEPLPTFGEPEEEDAEPVVDAAAFGEADRSDRMRDGYVEEGAEMGEVEISGLDVSLGGEEEDEEVEFEEVEEGASAMEEAIEEAMEDSAFDESAFIQPEIDEEEEAEAPAAEAPAADAPAADSGGGSDFIDLGGMIFDSGEEKTTRFQVAYEEPSGDEQADFAKMLSQFKKKVSENLEASDVRAHHDLGTAYKEMGLLDEAIEEFQAALRASAHHLPTYELLGQTFMEKGQNDAAVRSLTRALDAPYEVEDELIGIYYYLGRAYEELGNAESAREFYDRVFSLDINFADVTERLRTLR